MVYHNWDSQQNQDEQEQYNITYVGYNLFHI
jgi:hypothetical protein